MQVTERDIARIPRGNVRVPVAEFAELWRAAEDREGRDWYGAGITMTCRWMATAIVRYSDNRWSPHPARAPVTHHTRRAYEELIEAELFAAEKLDMQRPRPEWLLKRPGWIEAVCATLRWAWHRSGPTPLTVHDQIESG